MQADTSHQFLLLAQLDKSLERLAALRAAALCGIAIGALLLLLAVTLRAAQPLLPWFAGLSLCAIAVPVLLASHLAFRLKRQTKRSLARYLFRHGYRVDYPEFEPGGLLPASVRLASHVTAPR